MRWRLVCALLATLLVLGVACGGRSVRHDEGQAGEGAEGPEGSGGRNAATGGNGVGGTGSGAASATGGAGGGSAGIPIHPPRSCEFEGALYRVGDTVEDPLICRSCVCRQDGQMECSHCDATCLVSSLTLEVGATMVLSDGCTRCLCTVNGVDCSSDGCASPDPCRDLTIEYEYAVGALRWCGPQHGNYTCVNAVRAPDSVPCGCNVVVRDSTTYTDIADRYYERGCPVPPVCERICTEPEYPYHCGISGFCVGDP